MLPGLDVTQTDNSARENKTSQDVASAGLRQYGTINFAAHGSSASAAATNAEAGQTWLWLGLGAVAVFVVWLIARRH